MGTDCDWRCLSWVAPGSSCLLPTIWVMQRKCKEICTLGVTRGTGAAAIQEKMPKHNDKMVQSMSGRNKVKNTDLAIRGRTRAGKLKTTYLQVRISHLKMTLCFKKSFFGDGVKYLNEAMGHVERVCVMKKDRRTGRFLVRQGTCCKRDDDKCPDALRAAVVINPHVNFSIYANPKTMDSTAETFVLANGSTVQTSSP